MAFRHNEVSGEGSNGSTVGAMMLSRRNLLRSAGMFGLLGAVPVSARALADTRFDLIRAEVDRYVAEGKVAGMIAAIGFGQADPEYMAAGHPALTSPDPVTPDTLWRIYSMTKPITGMATMMLIDEGKLSLDQPLADILPAFANMQVQVTPDGSITDLKPAKSQITIRQLLTHSAGLGYSIIQKGPIKQAYIDAGVIPGQVSKTQFPGMDRGDPAPSLEVFADNLAKLPLVYEPGTKWSYSVGLDLMGRVIEVISGMPFDTFLQQRIFDPLGMTSTFFTVPKSDIERLSTNYAPVGGALIPLDPGNDSRYSEPPAFPFGGAGLVSSARDYDKFLKMLVGKGAMGSTRILSEVAAMKGMSNLLPEGVDTSGTWVEGQGFGAGGRVGLGNARSPAGTYGWGGAAGTVAFVDTIRGLRAAGYTQYMPAEIYPFQNEFPALVYRDLMS